MALELVQPRLGLLLRLLSIGALALTAHSANPPPYNYVSIFFFYWNEPRWLRMEAIVVLIKQELRVPPVKRRMSRIRALIRGWGRHADVARQMRTTVGGKAATRLEAKPAVRRC